MNFLQKNVNFCAAHMSHYSAIFSAFTIETLLKNLKKFKKMLIFVHIYFQIKPAYMSHILAVFSWKCIVNTKKSAIFCTNIFSNNGPLMSHFLTNFNTKRIEMLKKMWIFVQLYFQKHAHIELRINPLENRCELPYISHNFPYFRPKMLNYAYFRRFLRKKSKKSAIFVQK